MPFPTLPGQVVNKETIPSASWNIILTAIQWLKDNMFPSVLTTKGDILTRSTSDYIRFEVGQDGEVLTADAESESGMKWAPPAPGGGGDVVYNFPAGSFDYPVSDPAPLDTDTGTNGTVKSQLFDSTTDEFILGQFSLPSDISSFTTITFEAFIYHKTNKTSKTVQFVFSHSAKATTESWVGLLLMKRARLKLLEITPMNYSCLTGRKQLLMQGGPQAIRLDLKYGVMFLGMIWMKMHV